MPPGFLRSPLSATRLPAAGGHLLAGSSDTGGQFTLIHTSVPPHDETPLHRHLEMDESFFIIEGSLDVTCGGDTFEAGRSEFVFLPREVPHRYSAGADGAELLILGSPAGLEHFFDDWEDGMSMERLEAAHRIEFL